MPPLCGLVLFGFFIVSCRLWVLGLITALAPTCGRLKFQLMAGKQLPAKNFIAIVCLRRGSSACPARADVAQMVEQLHGKE